MESHLPDRSLAEMQVFTFEVISDNKSSKYFRNVRKPALIISAGMTFMSYMGKLTYKDRHTTKCITGIG